MKNNTTFVIGGCRSGKSSHALYLANQIQGSKKIFMATSVPTDKEMYARVDKHQKERGKDWITIEEPIDIPLKIREISKCKLCDVVLVDCLTLWVSNMMFNDFDDDKILQITENLQQTLQESLLSVFLVSNEVGMGIVPENSVARRFRDLAGMVNQKIAQAADKVVYMVAGIPMNVK